MLGTRCMSLLGFRVVAKVSGSSNTLNISPPFGRLRFEWQTRAYSCNAVLEFCTNTIPPWCYTMEQEQHTQHLALLSPILNAIYHNVPMTQ